MSIFTPKKKNLEVTFIEEKIIVIKGERWHHHSHELQQIRDGISTIIKQNNKIMGTQKEEAAKVAAIATQLAKANTEIQAKIQALVDAAAGTDNVQPELQAAIDALVPAAQTLDDIVPDAPTP